MKLENYEVHLPSYSIGDHIYDKIGSVCESYGKTVLLIGGRRALKAAEGKIRTYVAKTNLEIIGVELYGSDCTYETVEKLRQLPVYHKADMVFGVGGGKALDTVKCLCITDDKPVFTFPTIASNCAACTSVSIMYNEDGTFLKPNFLYGLPCTHLSTRKSLPKLLHSICGRALAIPMPNTMRQPSLPVGNSWNISPPLVWH